MHLGSQSFFFWSRVPKTFWSSFSATFGKKEAKRRHETSTVNQQLLSLSCVVLARRGETLFIIKGFGERKGAELLLLLTRFIERTIYLLRFKADIPLLFFLRCF